MILSLSISSMGPCRPKGQKCCPRGVFASVRLLSASSMELWRWEGQKSSAHCQGKTYYNVATQKLNRTLADACLYSSCDQCCPEICQLRKNIDRRPPKLALSEPIRANTDQAGVRNGPWGGALRGI